MFRVTIIIFGAFIIIPDRFILSPVLAADYGLSKTYTNKDYSLTKNVPILSSSTVQQQQQTSNNIGIGQQSTSNYYQPQQQSQPLPQQQISPSSLLAGPLYKMTDASTTSNLESGGNTIQAAVQSKHEIQFRDYPTTGNVVPTTVEVGAVSIPLNILFKSASSSLRIQQAHEGSEGSVQETASEDEPHRLVHSVKKPIIQEVHEVITPFRKITQEIHPVQEHIVTVIARGSEQQKQQEGENSGNSIENANNEFMEKIYEKVQQPIGLTNKQSSSSYGSSQTNIHGSAGDTGTGVSLSKATTKGGY